jgi:hypothetical protein
VLKAALGDAARSFLSAFQFFPSCCSGFSATNRSASAIDGTVELFISTFNSFPVAASRRAMASRIF